MLENPFKNPSSKEKQEDNLLSFAEAKELIKSGNSEYLVDNFEKLSHLSLDQQFEIVKLIIQNEDGAWELANDFEKLSHLSPNQQFEIMKLINKLDLPINTLEELNDLPEEDKNRGFTRNSFRRVWIFINLFF